MIQKISSNRQTLMIVLAIMLIIISYESAQQLYLVERYNIVENASFWELFKYQAYRWIIWVLVSYVLLTYIKRESTKDFTNLNTIYKYSLLIILLVFVDVMIISVVQILLSEQQFSITLVINEYFPFYAYQKGPLYLIGYISLAVIIHLYFVNRQLKIEVLNLGDLKSENAHLYTQLRESFADGESVLTVKIGNKQRIIPFGEINWIEADDYCSKVHTQNNSSSSMRISLKALEKKLNKDFLRVHRGAIVNMSKVSEFQFINNYQLHLKDQTIVPVSKSRVKFIKNYLSNGI